MVEEPVVWVLQEEVVYRWRFSGTGLILTRWRWWPYNTKVQMLSQLATIGDGVSK